MKRLASIVMLVLFGCGKPPPEEIPPRVYGPDAPEIRYVGRFDRGDAAGPRFAWPGSTISFRFTGTSAALRLNDMANDVDDYGEPNRSEYNVVIDGAEPVRWEIPPGEGLYRLAENLPPGEHELVFFKRTEAWIGETQLLGIELDPGAELLPPRTRPWRLEFVGDAVTVGYGNEGPDASCQFSGRTQNHWDSFAAMTARTLDADHVAVAASGIGVTRNYHLNFMDLMEHMFVRAVPTREDSIWEPGAWSPNAVIFNAGSTDFEHGDPGEEIFVRRYLDLISLVRKTYPSALLVVTFGPKLRDDWPAGVQSLTLGRRYVARVVAEAGPDIRFLEFEPHDASEGYGCDYHPSKAVHARMAQKLSAFLTAELQRIWGSQRPQP